MTARVARVLGILIVIAATIAPVRPDASPRTHTGLRTNTSPRSTSTMLEQTDPTLSAIATSTTRAADAYPPTTHATPTTGRSVIDTSAADACVAKLSRDYGPRDASLSAIAAKDGVTWTAISEGGIGVSTDAGVTWRWNCDDVIGHVGGLVATSRREAWAWSIGGLYDRVGAGQSLYKTDDGGSSWHEVELPFSGLRLDIKLVVFVDRDAGWIVASGDPEPQRLLFRTQDGGRSWDVSRLPVGLPFSSLSFADRRHGWMGADSAEGGEPFFATDDGGVTWTPADLGEDVTWAPYVVRTSASAGHVLVVRRRDPATPPPERGSPTGHGLEPSPGGLLSTTDGGRTWKEHDLPVESIWAVDAEHATLMGGEVGEYTSSHGYAVHLVAYATKDGGASWHALADPPDLHSASGLAGDGPHLWIQGQNPVLARSADGGRTWATIRLTSGDVGS